MSLLDHESFRRDAPVFQRDPCERVRVKKNSEVVGCFWVQVLEELVADDERVKGVLPIAFPQFVVFCVVSGLDGIETLLEKIGLPLDLPVTQEVLVGRREGGDEVSAPGPPNSMLTS